MAVLLGAIILAVVVLVLRGDDEAGEEDVPVYGTPVDTNLIVIEDEVGVFDSTTDVITMPPLDTPVADTPSSTATPAPAPARTARAQPSATQPSAAVRSRAAAAIPRYQAELAKNPSDPLLLNNYGWALHEAGQYAQAELVLREVIRIAPNRAIAYANLGESLWKQGKNDEALAMYRRFLVLNTHPRRERIAQGKVAAIRADGGRP